MPEEGWRAVVIPVAIAIAFFFLGLALRNAAFRYLRRWIRRREAKGWEWALEVVRGPLLVVLVTLGGLDISLRLAPLTRGWIDLGGKVLWAFFILSITWIAAGLGGRLARTYLERWLPSLASSGEKVARGTAALVGLLVLLEGIGFPITPVLIVLGVGGLAGVLAFRDTLADWASGLYLAEAKGIKPGVLLRLERGDEGYVRRLGWRSMEIEGLDGALFVVPYRRAAQGVIVLTPPSLRKATHSFHFNTRFTLKELSGEKAANLRELADYLRRAPEAVIYNHTHQVVQRLEYLDNQPPNDFAYWVEEELGEKELAERLASIDTTQFTSLDALRHRIVQVLEEYVAENPDQRQAREGGELHFVRSSSFILPTQYRAYDLRGFTEALRKASPDSLYHHIFEARLRLKKGTNDFSLWLRDSLGEEELARKIDTMDPYSYSLEGLRVALVRLIEEHLEARKP